MPRPSALAALCVALATAATAQTGADGLAHTRPQPPGVTPLPAEEQPAWNAIGRVNVAGFRMARMCTGTLIAPDRVLTAAHCTLAANGAPARPDRLIFVAGWRVGNAAASGKAVRVTRHAAWRPGRSALSNPAADLAILHLAEPLAGIRPIPIAAAGETAGALTILGYRGDRPHILHRYAPCPVTALRAKALRIGCRAAPGTSGAPVLGETRAGPRLVAVVSSVGPSGSLAARPDAWPPARP